MTNIPSDAIAADSEVSGAHGGVDTVMVVGSAYPAEPLQESGVERGRSGPMLSLAYAGVLLFCAVYFFRPEDFIPGLAFVPMAKITGVIAAVGLLLAIFSGHLWLRSEVKLLLGLFAYLVICIPFSFWPGGSFDVLLVGFSKIVLIAIAAMTAVTSLLRLRRLMLLQTLAMLFLGVLAIQGGKQHGRMYGVGQMFDDPNDFALNLCIILPFCVAWLCMSRRLIGRLFWVGAIGFVLFSVA
jgi:hypothetical protein